MKHKAVKCCVVTCGSKRKDVMLHKFPKTEIGLQKWLECINSDYLRSLDSHKLQRMFVCQKHFEKKWLRSTDPNSRILFGAYPTLFSYEEMCNGFPQNVTPTYTIEQDHNYAIKKIHKDHTYCQELCKTCDNVVLEDHSCSQNADVKCRRIETDPSTSSENLPTSPTFKNLANSSSLTGAAITSTPRKSAKRKHVILNKKSLTPKCHRLYGEYLKSRRQLNFTKRVKRALKFSKAKSFEKMTEKMNPLAKKVLWMQVKQCTKNVKGRRFSNEEKLIALSIMKQSPKSYKFLRKIFILPSKQILNKMISELHIEVGINTQIFDAIKQEVNTWVENKRYCTIMFDEVALETALAYDKNKDNIDGFVELNEKTNEFADHALVFMLRGAVYKWQQPLAFYFCKGATTKIELKGLIKKIVTAVSDTGLLPVALVCDQGSAFQSTIKSFQEDTKRKYITEGRQSIDDVIEIEGHVLSVFYDPPHLIKGVRNNFLTKNIIYDKKISKWSDIVDIYKADCSHAQMRLLHKLNDEHVIPEKIKKMKVKNCTKVLSKTVAATLSYTAQFSHYSDGSPVSSTLKNTAEIVSFFDDLFDSVNGASLINKEGKPLRKAVTEKSPHYTFWRDAIQKLKGIKFVTSCGKETSVPSIKNFITTLKSYQRVCQFFKSKNIKVMRPRYFNSDPIENFFGQVRAYNFRNNDPSCHTFKSTFRSLLITRFIKFHSDTFNCEDASGEQLLKLKTLFKKNDNDINNEVAVQLNICSPEANQSSSQCSATVTQERMKIHSRAYTAGWVIRKVLKKYKCGSCKASLTVPTNANVTNTNMINNYIMLREYKTIKQNKLTYPSENAVKVFGEISNEAMKQLESHPSSKNIIQRIRSIILNSNDMFDFINCSLHREAVVEYFINLTLRLNVFNWCNTINKILKGTDVLRLHRTNLPKMQEKAYKKYLSKLKNKKINK